METKVILWDADPDFREALFTAMFNRGINPTALKNPRKLPRALDLLEPDLLVLEGDWPKGARLDLSENSLSLCGCGQLSLILPHVKGGSQQGAILSGIVLDNLQKPFGTEELFSALQSALRLKSRLESGIAPGESYLEIKRLTAGSEIFAALELRYEVYREIGYIGHSESRIDFDLYDSRSLFLGAFICQNGDRELAGCLRIIRQTEPCPAHRNILGAILRSREINISFPPETGKIGLPACESFRLRPEDLSGYAPGFGSAVSVQGTAVAEEICELSRLVIKRKYRKHRLGIERRLFEAVVVDCCAAEPLRNWLIIAVHPSRCAKFERYGFSQLDGLGDQLYTGIRQPAVLMALDLQRYLTTPNPFVKNLDLNTLLYKVTGSLAHGLEVSPVFQKI